MSIRVIRGKKQSVEIAYQKFVPIREIRGKKQSAEIAYQKFVPIRVIRGKKTPFQSVQSVSNLIPAIFLDRDGVINHNRSDYVKTWEEYSFLPGVFPALNRLAHSNYLIVIVSNQSPIGRGLVQQETIENINARMKAEIERQGGRVDAIYYCPHAPGDNCNCRKPRPGMFLQAAQELGIDLASSLFIGDALSDVKAAFNAGCNPIMVLTGRGKEQHHLLREHGHDKTVPVVDDLAAAVRLIETNAPQPP